MLARFKFYRRWRGGYWVFFHFIGWRRCDFNTFKQHVAERMASPDWSFENYGVQK